MSPIGRPPFAGLAAQLTDTELADELQRRLTDRAVPRHEALELRGLDRIMVGPEHDDALPEPLPLGDLLRDPHVERRSRIDRVTMVGEEGQEAA